jgi:hypothetical protein
MNGFRKIFPTFLTHYATFLAKMAERKVVPFDEFYYQLKLMHPFQKHPVYNLYTFRYKKVRAPQAEHVFLLLQRVKILFPRYLIISCFIKK